MPRKNPPITMTLTEQLLKQVEDFRFENRINTRSEAIRRLLEEALKKYKKRKPKK
jgi:metal-responsive CopG/Arc/MetJ family transcriptional regulator